MRYFTPGTNTPKSLFVPLPLEFMGEKMQAAQTGYDTAMDDAATAASKLKVNYAPYTKHVTAAQQLLQTYQDKFLATTDEIEKTRDYKGAARKVTSLINAWENDPTRKLLETSYDQYYNTYQKGKFDLADDYAEYNDENLNFEQIQNSSDTLLPFIAQPLGKIQPWATEARAQTADIKDEGLKIVVPVIGKDGTITTTTTSSKGVTPLKAGGLSYAKIQSFLDTKEGTDYAKMLLYYNPNLDTESIDWNKDWVAAANKGGDTTGLTPFENTSLYGKIGNYLYNAASNQIGLDYENGQTLSFIPEWMAEKLYTPPEVPINPATSFNVKGMDLTDDFTRKTRSTGSEAVTGAMTGYVPGGLGVSYNTTEENSYPWVNWSDKQKAIYKKIGAAYGLEDQIDKVFSGKATVEEEDSAAKFMATYTKLLNQAFQEAPTATAFSSENAEEATTIAFGDNPTVKNLNSAFASANHFYDPNTGEVYNSWADLKARLIPTISDYANDNSAVRISGQVLSAEHSMPIATADSEGNPDWSFTNPYTITIGSYPIYMSNYAGTTANKTKGKILATTSKIYNASKLSLNNTPISVGKLFNDSDLYTVKTLKNSKTETITYPGTKVSIPSGSYAVSNTLTTEDGKEHTVVGVGVDPASALDDYKNEQTLFLQTLKK